MNKSYTLALVVIALLAVVALSHQFLGMTAEDLAVNKPQVHSHDHDEEAPGEHDGQAGQVELPSPMGAPDAYVKVKVYVTSDNECDVTTMNAMQHVAEKFGEDVYITFSDLLDEQVQAEAHAAKISCKSGLTINDQSKFILPERGLQGTVLLDGPVGEMNYNMVDVEAIIEHLLGTREEGATDD